MKIEINDISWDTMDEANNADEAQLPFNVVIEEDDDLVKALIDRAIHSEYTIQEELDEALENGEIADWLSDNYGWCVLGCTANLVED